MSLKSQELVNASSTNSAQIADSSTPSTPSKKQANSISSPTITIESDLEAGAKNILNRTNYNSSSNTTSNQNQKQNQNQNQNRIPNLRYQPNLADSSENLPMTTEAPPITPTHTKFDPRRYSASNSTTSPSQNQFARNLPNPNRARPRSAIYLDSPINEDAIVFDSPVSYSNTPRNRNSYSFAPSRTYMPPPSMPPSMPPPRSNPASRSTSPSRSGSRSNVRTNSPSRSSSPSKSAPGPFNFKPNDLMLHSNNSNGSLSVKPAYRKGHRYKHSSVSMNLFQEPPQKAPLKIPASLPIPTIGEFLNSMSNRQHIHLIWAMFHLFFAVFVFYMGFHYSLNNLSTLSHLIFYDAIGTMAIVSVDIMANFDVWNSSSIKHPFGLGRIEVLVGFALSASLIMVGGDLISHTFEEFIVAFVMANSEGSHSHHVHSKDNVFVDWFNYELTLVFTVIVTLISSNLIYYEKINNITGGKQNFKNITNTIIQNPTHIITFFFTIYLVFYPIIIKIDSVYEINEISTIVIALIIIMAGWRLVKQLGSILLLSYPYEDDKAMNNLLNLINKKITDLDAFKSYYKLSNLFISKFNYKLFVIGLKINIKNDSDDDEYRLRFEINRLILKVMNETNLNCNDKVEITIDIDRY